MEGHSQAINCIIRYEKKVIVSSSLDKTIKFWNIVTGRCLKTISSNCGSIGAIVKVNNSIVCSWSDMTVKIFSSKDRTNILDKRLMLSSLFYHKRSGLLFGGGLDKLVIWDITEKQRISLISLESKNIFSMNGNSNSVLLGGDNDKLYRYNIETKSLEHLVSTKRRIKSIQLISKDEIIFNCINTCITTYNISKAIMNEDYTKANLFIKYLYN